MLKDILISTAQIINRDDIIEELERETPSSSQLLQNDIMRLISYYNYIMETLCENYFQILDSQTIYSDKNKQISFLNFNHTPTKIVSVKKNGRNVFFSEYSRYITVPEPKISYEITYKFLPNKVRNLSDEITLPYGINQKIICYGIASEFLASKNMYSQAQYWNDKFMLEIFKSKTSKNRKLKRTFVIWKPNLTYFLILSIL